MNHIGKVAFEDCIKLEKTAIPRGVTTICDRAFLNCKNLEKITVPRGVRNMGSGVFGGCEKLTIYCEAKKKPKGWSEEWNPDNLPVVWGYKQ